MLDNEESFRADNEESDDGGVSFLSREELKRKDEREQEENEEGATEWQPVVWCDKKMTTWWGSDFRRSSHQVEPPVERTPVSRLSQIALYTGFNQSYHSQTGTAAPLWSNRAANTDNLVYVCNLVNLGRKWALHIFGSLSLNAEEWQHTCKWWYTEMNFVHWLQTSFTFGMSFFLACDFRIDHQTWFKPYAGCYMLYHLGLEYIVLPSNAIPMGMCLRTYDGAVHVYLHVFLLTTLLVKKKPEKS